MAEATIQCEDNGRLPRQQQHHASSSRQNVDDAMRFLPELSLFNIQRWIGSSSNKAMSQYHDSEISGAKPKRMNAQVDWEVEEFERDLALRFATRDLSLELEGTNAAGEENGIDLGADLALAFDDPYRTAATPTPTPRTPHHDKSSVKQSFRQRWLRSQTSSATIQALSSSCHPPRASSPLPVHDDFAYEASDEELDFSQTRPSTPSTATPPPYPLAHYSMRAREEEHSEELCIPVNSMHTDQDMEVTPALTSSPSSSPSPITGPVTPISSPSDKSRHRHSIRDLFRTSINSSNTASTGVSSTKATIPTSPTTSTTSQSALSLVSHFSSCTSSCGDSNSPLSDDEDGRRDSAQMSSLLRRVRMLTLSSRQLPHPSTMQEQKQISRMEEGTGSTRRLERRYSSPAGTAGPPRTQEPAPPLPCALPPVLKDIRNKRRSVISETATKMKMKRKKKRLIIRGIGEDDWEAVEGLGRWASSLGEVRKMTRVRDGTMWIEFRDRKVADNVCHLHARVEIPGVGHVVIDWAESRQAG